MTSIRQDSYPPRVLPFTGDLTAGDGREVGMRTPVTSSVDTRT